MDIAVIGSNMVDLIAYINRMPEEGETVEAPDFTIGCGGKGANQAVAASRLGSDVLMVTRVGNDVFAANTIENFARNGIDTAHVLPTDATSGVAPIFVDPQAHNSIIIIKGANALLTPADVEAAEPDIAQCSLIVLQLEVPLDTVYAAIDRPREAARHPGASQPCARPSRPRARPRQGLRLRHAQRIRTGAADPHARRHP